MFIVKFSIVIDSIPGHIAVTVFRCCDAFQFVVVCFIYFICRDASHKFTILKFEDTIKNLVY